jgi:hypothetical protein
MATFNFKKGLDSDSSFRIDRNIFFNGDEEIFSSNE